MRIRFFWARALSVGIALLCVSCGNRGDESTDYARYWPGPKRALFKLSNDLILTIPPQYQQFWVERDHVVREPASIEHLGITNRVGFEFELPNYTGYTAQNYQNQFDPDRVEVISLSLADPKQTAPDAPGDYPPNMLKRLLHGTLDPSSVTEQYGLQCYGGHGADRIFCYGQRDAAHHEDILFYTYVPPYASWVKFPIMQASYFSSAFGGTRITWRTHAKNFPHWREIDQQIWAFIRSWNVAGKCGPSSNTCE